MKNSEPTPAALREMPEMDVATAVKKFGRGKSALQKVLAASREARGPGRPRAGEEAEGTEAKSIRLPRSMWKRLDEAAALRNTTRHALMRAAIQSALVAESTSWPDMRSAKAAAKKTGA